MKQPAIPCTNDTNFSSSNQNERHEVELGRSLHPHHRRLRIHWLPHYSQPPFLTSKVLRCRLGQSLQLVEGIPRPGGGDLQPGRERTQGTPSFPRGGLVQRAGHATSI